MSPAAARGKAASCPIRELLAEQRPSFMQAGRLSLVIAVLSLVPSWYMLEVYGRVLSSRNHETLAWLVLIALVLYAILELLEVARSRVLFKAASVVNEQLTPRSSTPASWPSCASCRAATHSPWQTCAPWSISSPPGP